MQVLYVLLSPFRCDVVILDTKGLKDKGPYNEVRGSRNDLLISIKRTKKMLTGIGLETVFNCVASQ